MNPDMIKAQQAIGRRDYQTAADCFSRMISSMGGNHGSQMPLLSRATCYSAMGKDHMNKVVDDCKEVLRLQDIVSPTELLPGCYSTHIASMTLLGQTYHTAGDKTEAEKWRMLATERLKRQGAAHEQATALKDKGNAVYKTGKIEEALKIYQHGFALDGTSGVIASNICQCLLTLNRLDEAAEWAEKCIRLSPTWGKAWYRKGMVAMKQSKYLAATTSFQTGLTHDPENPDLKSQYVVASKLAEKEGSKGGFDTKLMALMMELRQNSWSVRAWANNQKFIHYLGFGDDSGGSTVAVISKKTKDNDAVVSITEVKAAFAASAASIKSWWSSLNLPTLVAESPSLQTSINTILKLKNGGGDGFEMKWTDIRTVLFPESPLISLLLLFVLIRAYEKKNQTIANTNSKNGKKNKKQPSMTWCFQINKTILENPVFANENPNARITDPDTIKSKGFNTVFTSPLYAHLSMHGCYAALVLGDENNGGDGDGGYGQVLDFLHLWSILETDAHLNGSDEQQLNDADAAAMMMGSLHRGYAFELFMLGRISGSGKSATAIGDEMQVYTCEDEKKMVEFLQRFSLQNTILPVPKASSSGGGDGGSSSRSSSDPKKVATEVLKVMLKDNIKEGSSPAASASISASESPSSHLTSGNDSNTTTPISKSKKSSPTTTTTLYSESAQLAGLAVAVVAVAIFLYLAGF